jgi:hypothetical protein
MQLVEFRKVAPYKHARPQPSRKLKSPSRLYLLALRLPFSNVNPKQTRQYIRVRLIGHFEMNHYVI